MDCRDAHGWAPACLVILTTEGTEVGRLWHPGHLARVRIVEFEDQGPKILVSAINNTLTDRFPSLWDGHPRTLFQIDAKNLVASLKGAEMALDQIVEWYQVVTPSPHDIYRLDVINDDRKPGKKISLWTAQGIVWSLAFDGTVISREFDDSFKGDEGELVMISPSDAKIIIHPADSDLSEIASHL